MYKGNQCRVSRCAVAITGLALFCSASAYAGGLYIREFGQPTQAMSGAGANILAEDASTAFQNAAGLFKLDGDSNWMVTGMALVLDAEFDLDESTTIPGNDGGNAGDTLFGGALFYTKRLSEDWGLAVSFNSYSGSAVDYGAEFAGRYLGYETELLTVGLTPHVAYRFSDKVSVSAGLSM